MPATRQSRPRNRPLLAPVQSTVKLLDDVDVVDFPILKERDIPEREILRPTFCPITKVTAAAIKLFQRVY